MNLKKNILKVMSLIEYVSLILATVAVLTFQFLPYLICIMVALGCYTLGFFMASIRSVLNCVEIFFASKQVNGEEQALVTSSKVEVLNSKKERVLAVLGAIMWIALFAFALVVLILYPKTI